MRPYNRIDAVAALWAVVALTRLAGTFAILLGIGFTLGGKSRMSGPAWTVVDRVPGTPASCGLILAALGALTLCGSLLGWQIRIAGLWVIAVWYALFAVSFAIPLVQNRPGVAVTGPLAYGFFIAGAHVVLAVVQRPEPG